MRFLTLFFFLLTIVNALNFTVASYNVENFFDLKNDGTEYKEYIPNTKFWSKKTLDIKLKHTVQTIKDLDTDIIALQEIESQKALNLLLEKLPSYKYSCFLKNQKSSVGVGVLSKYKIIKTKEIPVDKFDIYSRPILEVTFKIDNLKFKIYNNHWRSKKAPENTRTKYATALKNIIFSLSDDIDYILLGDFNSNYNEWQTFKFDKKLNNTYGLTGINHILNTVEDDKLILQTNINNFKNKVHYNLWLEFKKQDRFSYKFRNENNTPDNIMLPPALFDNKNISYLDDSFKVFKPKYLYKNSKIQRWKNGKGYSDHLPILASFTTKKNYKAKATSLNIKNNIAKLYTIEHIDKPINLKDVIVIYKSKNNAIIKEKNGRAIYIYNNAQQLEIGRKYNLTVNKLTTHYGLLEIKDISNIKKQKNLIAYKKLYLDANKIDIFDIKYTNDIVTNLNGIYKKGYLYLENNKRIKLYFPKNFKKPLKNAKITVNTGHLGIYKGKVQILIHKKSDIKPHYD